MRFIKVSIPPYYVPIIEKAINTFKVGKELNADFFWDLLVVIAQGYDGMFRNLCSVQDIYDEASDLFVAGKIRNMRVYVDEQYLLRLNLIDFADSGFARVLREEPALTLEEKYMLTVSLLDAMYNSQYLNNGLKQSLNNQSGSSGQGNQSKSMSASFFKGFTNLVDAISDGAAPQGTSSRGCTPLADMYKESMEGKLTISNIVDTMLANKMLEIYHIAKNLEMSFGTSRKGVFTNCDEIASNLATARMRKMKDIQKAVRLDLGVEDAFDRKVMTKTLRVVKFRKRRDQKQCLYALLDGSGSMSRHYDTGVSRIMFVKAIAIALGKKSLNEGGVFFFRWFRGYVKDMYTLERREQWSKFLQFVLNESPTGETDIDLALHAASSDIEAKIKGVDRADMIVLTDGTQDITNPDDFQELRKKGLKYHFVLLEDCDDHSNIEKIAETFQIMDLQKLKSIDDYVPEFRRVI